MRVYVTQKDINEGVRHSVSSCPVALSLKRRGFKKVEVDSIIIIVDDYIYNTYKLKDGEKVRIFISHFDTNQLVKPFSFTLKNN